MGKVNVSGQDIEFNDDYSFSNYANQDLFYCTDMHDTTIYSSQFYWEKPHSSPFPPSATGLVFVSCNLDNIILPMDAVTIGCSQRYFQAQNDGEDWFVDANGSPIEPMNKEAYIALGLSISPADLPAQKMSQSIIAQTIEARNS